MTPVLPAVSTSATPQPTDWVLPTAVAGTIGSILSFGSALFISIFVNSDRGGMPSSPDGVRDSLVWTSMLIDCLYGSAFGLVLGTAFAFTWGPLLAASRHHVTRWTRTIIVSFLFGGLLASVLNNLGPWYWMTFLERSFLSGLVGGCVTGGLQAPILWEHRAAQWRWTLLHTLAFCGAFVLLMLALRHVSSLIILPLVWLSVWGLYGLCVGAGFDHVQFHYPNE